MRFFCLLFSGSAIPFPRGRVDMHNNYLSSLLPEAWQAVIVIDWAMKGPPPPTPFLPPTHPLPPSPLSLSLHPAIYLKHPASILILLKIDR